MIFEFDPEVLSLVEAYEGSLYVYSGYNTWFEAEEESLGVWEIFDVVFPAMSFVVAPGEPTRVRFRAESNGYSAVHSLSLAVMDIYRDPLDPLTWEDAVVAVGPATGMSGEAPEFARWGLGPYPTPRPGGRASRSAGRRPPGPRSLSSLSMMRGGV